MSGFARYAIVLALGFGVTGLGSPVHCQTKTAKKTPTGSISGRITIRGKGLAGVVVGVRGLNGPQPSASALKATTDQDGNYQITEVPAGNYQVFPIAPVYVIPDPAVSRARGKMLLLAEGENVQGIDFSLVRGGVITGKVTDADGRPVIEERLSILPLDQNTQPIQMYGPGVSGLQTDDRGVYRIYGLAPGRYKVSVGIADDNQYVNFNFGRSAYKRTFYPDAVDPDDAKVIEITEGSEATNIDITVGRSLPSFSAGGKLIDGETEQPVTGIRLGLQRVLNERNAPVMMNGIISASNSLGEFRLENVTPGKYVVLALPQPGSELRVEPVTFEIVDQDVTGLLLKSLRGVSVAGTVVLDGTYNKSVMAKLTQLRLSAFVYSKIQSPSFGQESAINPDGSFRIGGLAAGTANFALRSPDRLPTVNFAILRLERDGITHARGIEIKAGEQLTGVKIIVSYGTGSIRGEVTVENGPLPQGGRIVAWIKKPGETSSNFRPYNLDLRGHFLIEGVPAGTYELNVNANIPGRRGQISAKQTVSVTEDSVSEVSVSLDLKSDPGKTP